MVQLALWTPVEPDTTTTEAVPTCPASPTEAITVSSGEEAEAGDATSGAALLTVSDLLHVIPIPSKSRRARGWGSPRRLVPWSHPGGRSRRSSSSLLSQGVVVTLIASRRNPRYGEGRP